MSWTLCFESEIYRPTVYELLFITAQKVILNQHSYFHLHTTIHLTIKYSRIHLKNYFEINYPIIIFTFDTVST